MIVPNDCIPNFLRSTILCTTYLVLRSKFPTGCMLLAVSQCRLGIWLLACEGHYIPSGLGFGLSPCHPLWNSCLLPWPREPPAWRTLWSLPIGHLRTRRPDRKEEQSSWSAFRFFSLLQSLIFFSYFLIHIYMAKISLAINIYMAKSVPGRGNSRLIAPGQSLWG